MIFKIFFIISIICFIPVFLAHILCLEEELDLFLNNNFLTKKIRNYFEKLIKLLKNQWINFRLFSILFFENFLEKIHLILFFVIISLITFIIFGNTDPFKLFLGAILSILAGIIFVEPTNQYFLEKKYFLYSFEIVLLFRNLLLVVYQDICKGKKLNYTKTLDEIQFYSAKIQTFYDNNYFNDINWTNPEKQKILEYLLTLINDIFETYSQIPLNLRINNLKNNFRKIKYNIDLITYPLNEYRSIKKPIEEDKKKYNEIIGDYFQVFVIIAVMGALEINKDRFYKVAIYL